MKKTKLIISIISAAVISISTVLILRHNSEKNNSADTQKYHFNFDFDSRFTADSAISKSKDFIYFAPLTGGLYEYDTKTEKMIELPPIQGDSSTQSGLMITDPQLYDGKVFSASWYAASYGENPTSFFLYNPDTGEYENLFSKKSGYGANMATISEEGIIFFTANLFGDNDEESGLSHYDDKGYNVGYSLLSYDINTKEEKTLIEGVNRYFIDGDRIYFDRFNRDNSVHLYYTTFDDCEKGNDVVDTGIDVGKDFLGYMWTIRDGIVYFADDKEDKALKTFDPESKEITEVFHSDMGIRTFDFWNDKIVFASRYQDEKNYWRSQISIYDTKTGKETLVCTEPSEEERELDRENAESPDYFIADDSLDYFIIETNTLGNGMKVKYYKADSEGNMTLLLNADE